MARKYKPRGLRRYMVWPGGAPGEGAMLVFARTRQIAKHLALPYLQSWSDCEYFDIRARWIRGEFHLDKLNPEGVPKVIESPPVCPHCETWGGEQYKDRCTNCEAEFDND